MRTVIVPLDFSTNSFNAAHYAAKMFSQQKDVTIVLYHYYAAGESNSTAREFLDSIKAELVTVDSSIETFIESGANFIDSLSAYAHVKRAYMIVMGLTGKTSLAKRFSGSNALKMTEKDVCPVLLVPSDAVYTGLDNVLISSEMRGVEETPTLLTVKRVLSDFKPSLHILNVNSEHYIELTPQVKEEKEKMGELLAEFNPEFHFLRMFDFHESVNTFAMDKNIDMIIIAPKYHNLFDRLFKTQHTKQLIYQSRIPLLLVHD